MTANDIIGRYSVVKVMSASDEKINLLTYEETKAVADKLAAEGSDEAEMFDDILQMFDSVIEFAGDGKIFEWMKIQEGMEEEIEEAVKEGEIPEVKDGFFRLEEPKVWKFEDGIPSYDTGETRIVGEEEMSSWDELTFDEDGLMVYGDGTMRLKKI